MTAWTEVTPAAPSPRRLLLGLRREFANWYVLGPVSWVVLPSRCPPRGGVKSLARRHVTVAVRGGYRAECRIDEFFSFVEVFVLREYEIAGVPWTSVRTIVDVGANVGAATLWFAQKAPESTIIAVEPSSEAARLLTRNVRVNRLDGRVRVAAVALADRAKEVALRQVGSSVFGKTTERESTPGERVAALSLGDLLEQHGLDEVDVLKLDCEGAEFDILHSSDDRLLRRHRFIVGEYHAEKRAELEGLLSRLEAARFSVSSSGGESLGLFRAVRT